MDGGARAGRAERTVEWMLYSGRLELEG
jgi:hypothetical protein